ncbi:hypothetical protein [Galbibacter sp. PAP.153]|uniref:hypothetical protein n=1 Tax=Galbibacter sp. PAP.153 TaxID=3104623 RepID=UPI0030093466
MKNKNIKNIKLLAICIAVGIMFASCLLDDEVTDFGTGPNLVGFANSTATFKAEANGQEVNSEIPVQIIGPSVNKFSDEVTVTISVDPSSTAEEGVNYRLNSKTITLTPDASEDIYEGGIPITIITDGISTPVSETPILNLMISEVSSNGEIVINDKTKSLSASIAYTCPYNINDYAGTYIATTDEFGFYIGQPQPFEVIDGPGENQFTMVNVAAHPEAYDVIVDVDPATGDLTIAKQPAFNTNNIGYTYGELRWEGTGTSAPSPGNCVGIIDITTTNTVDAGSFGQFRTVFEKQ